MKTPPAFAVLRRGNQNLLAVALVGAVTVTTAQAQSQFDKLANAPFKENRPTKETAQTLRDELLFQRVRQTYLWALPLINTLGMQFGSENTSGLASGRRIPRSVRATSQRRTPTAARIFSSARKRPPAKKATGMPPCPAKAISSSSGSTARPKPPLMRVGSPAKSRRCNDSMAKHAGCPSGRPATSLANE